MCHVWLRDRSLVYDGKRASSAASTMVGTRWNMSLLMPNFPSEFLSLPLGDGHQFAFSFEQAWLYFGNGWGIIDASGRSLYDGDVHALARVQSREGGLGSRTGTRMASAGKLNKGRAPFK